jgi:putative ABC transport system permease protein
MVRSLILALGLITASACDFPTTTSTSKSPTGGGQPSVGSFSPRRFSVDLGGGAIVAEPGAAVSGAFFKDADVPAMLGRVVLEDDASTSVSVISHAMWEQRFNGDPSIIGRSISLDDKPTTIVGVMPKSFQFPEGARIWVRR